MRTIILCPIGCKALGKSETKNITKINKTKLKSLVVCGVSHYHTIKFYLVRKLN